jgi:hypothetical protein
MSDPYGHLRSGGSVAKMPASAVAPRVAAVALVAEIDILAVWHLSQPHQNESRNRAGRRAYRAPREGMRSKSIRRSRQQAESECYGEYLPDLAPSEPQNGFADFAHGEAHALVHVLDLAADLSV